MGWRRGGWGMRGWGRRMGYGWGGPWGGMGQWGGWGWRRRGCGCFPCCSMVMLLPLLAFVAAAATLAVHFL
jgi:hypothetical protein